MEKLKILVVHHSADFDGLFCGEIAKKFLPGAQVVGWDFADEPLALPGPEIDLIYVLDLPVDRPFGLKANGNCGIEMGDGNYLNTERFIWIDHHKSSIDTHPPTIPGYRIDGVAACRLAWQWFQHAKDGGKDSFGVPYRLPDMRHYVDRVVGEPRAVNLAGEYDIWDKRNPDAEVFQFGLKSKELTDTDWALMLESGSYQASQRIDLLDSLLAAGSILQRYQREQDASLVKHRAFLMRFEGLNFLCLNTGRGNSLTFTSMDIPETGHDALCVFSWNGSKWTFSLYHANHRKDLDLSEIARKYGGGGHRGACGFQALRIPFEATL